MKVKSNSFFLNIIMGSTGINNLVPKEKKELQNPQLLISPISKNDFLLIHHIGKGGFGNVWEVQMKKNRKKYAMKELNKVKIAKKMAIKAVNDELNILSSINHFFITNLHYAFQTEDNLYIILDYFSGGDLRRFSARHFNKMFSEKEAKFISACILTALLFLRRNNIIHRDIKPDNILIDKEGYIHITDFGISKRKNEKKVQEIHDTSGTSYYMSPEAMIGLDQNFQTDYFSLGIVVFEMIFGKRPYEGKNKDELKKSVFNKEIKLIPELLPPSTFFEDKNVFCDFVNKLLIRKADKRLGAGGIEEVMSHPWFQKFDWDSLLNRKMESPLIEVLNCQSPTINFQHQKNENLSDYQETLTKINKSKQFKNFYYDERVINNKYSQSRGLSYKKEISKNLHLIQKNNKTKENDLLVLKKKMSLASIFSPKRNPLKGTRSLSKDVNYFE